MNTIIYNQLSLKLYHEYCRAKYASDASGEEFAKTMCIDPKVVKLFDALYFNEVGEIFNNIRKFFPENSIINIDGTDSLANRARLFAIQSHREVNQLYDGAPYEFHLYKVVQYFKKYKHHIPEQDWLLVEAICWLHDVVEDAHRTYNDLKKLVGEKVAQHACALTTNLHGVNRKARADADYYNRIKATEYGPFVKLCDRLANISNGGNMTDGYKKEMPGFLESLSPSINNYQDMIDELNELVNLKPKLVNI